MVAVIWGVNFVVIDWGMTGVPPLLFLTIRFVLVALPAVLMIVPRPQVPWWKVAAVGTFMSLGQFSLLYTAMHVGLPAGLASLVHQSQAIFTIVIAAGVLRERPTKAQMTGVGIGAVGLVIVAGGRGGTIPIGALMLCLSGAMCWAIGNVIARAAKVPGGLSLTVWSALVVPIPLFLLTLALDGPSAIATGLGNFGWKAALSTAYTVVLSSFVGYGVWNSLLARHQSSSVVPWVLLIPPVGIVAAWICFDERPNGAEVLGGVFLIVGVLVAQGVAQGVFSRMQGRSQPVTAGNATPVSDSEISQSLAASAVLRTADPSLAGPGFPAIPPGPEGP